MKFGTQQHIWNSMSHVTEHDFLKLNMADGPNIENPLLAIGLTLQPIARFHWNFARGVVFHRISAIGQVLAFNRMFSLFSWRSLGFGVRRLLYCLLHICCKLKRPPMAQSKHFLQTYITFSRNRPPLQPLASLINYFFHMVQRQLAWDVVFLYVEVDEWQTLCICERNTRVVLGL